MRCGCDVHSCLLPCSPLCCISFRTVKAIVGCCDVSASGAETSVQPAAPWQPAQEAEADDEEEYANCSDMPLPRAPVKPLPPVPVKRNTPQRNSQPEPITHQIGLS